MVSGFLGLVSILTAVALFAKGVAARQRSDALWLAGADGSPYSRAGWLALHGRLLRLCAVALALFTLAASRFA